MELVYSNFGVHGNRPFSWWEHTHFYYLECYRVTHDVGWELSYEMQWFNEAWLVRNGRCEIWSGEHCTIANAGDLVIIAAGRRRITRSLDAVPLEISGFHFHVDSNDNRNVFPQFDFPVHTPAPDESSTRFPVATLFDFLVDETVSQRAGYSFAAPALAQLILGEILRASRPAGETPEQFAQHLNAQMRRNMDSDIADSLQFIQEFYAREITLNALAARAHLSVSHFSRKFKAHLGLAPMDYLRVYRLERAREQLRDTRRDTQQSIAQVAAACGFYDASYFARQFKAHFGVTPRQIRTTTK